MLLENRVPKAQGLESPLSFIVLLFGSHILAAGTSYESNSSSS